MRASSGAQQAEKAATLVQAHARMVSQKRIYGGRRNLALSLQRLWRGKSVRLALSRLRAGLHVLQDRTLGLVRRARQRRKERREQVMDALQEHQHTANLLRWRRRRISCTLVTIGLTCMGMAVATSLHGKAVVATSTPDGWVERKKESRLVARESCYSRARARFPPGQSCRRGARPSRCCSRRRCVG